MMRLRMFLPMLAVAPGMLSPAEAQASRVLVVVRGVGAGADKAAAFVSHYLRASLAEDLRNESIDLVGTFGGSDQRRAVRAFQAAEEVTQKGRVAYESLDLDRAVEYLADALSKYERNAGYATDMKKVADTLMMLGATHILRGEEKTGGRRLGQAVTIYPEVKPDPRAFNPSMRKIFQRVCDRLMQRPRGSLTISSNPSYSAVYVDGVFAGVTPLSVGDLTEGRHFVRLEKDGYRNWGRVVDIVGRNEAAQTATLKPTKHLDDFDALADTAVRRATEGSGQGPIDDAVDQIGVLTNADHVMVGAVRLDGERVEVDAHLFDLNRQRRIKSARQVFSYDTTAQAYRREIGEFVRVQFSEGSGGGGATAAVPPKQSASAATASVAGPNDQPESPPTAREALCVGGLCNVRKTWTLVLGGGLGALLMGGGGALWVLARNDHTAYRKSVQISGDADDLERTGRQKALIGDILLGTGVAAALVSLGMYFLWSPERSADDVVSNTDHGLELGAAPVPHGGAFTAVWRF